MTNVFDFSVHDVAKIEIQPLKYDWFRAIHIDLLAKDGSKIGRLNLFSANELAHIEVKPEIDAFGHGANKKPASEPETEKVPEEVY